MSIQRSLGWFLALLLAVVPVRSALADRAAAEFYTQRGEAALRDRNWAAAQESFRKSLAEDEGFLPAHAGLAEALLGAGDRVAAATSLRKAVAVAEATSPLPAAWAPVVARVRKRLAETDTAGAQLDKIVEKYVTGLLGVADRWMQKDPDLAGAAIRDALLARPGDKRVQASKDRWEKLDAASWAPLFNGKDKSGWEAVDVREWSVSLGALMGDVPNLPRLAYTKATLSGDYDVRVEVKVLEKYDSNAMVGLLAAWTKVDHDTCFCWINDGFEWREADGMEEKKVFAVRAAEMEVPVDIQQWTTFEMRFRGDVVTGLVNGKVVGTAARSATRREGAIALQVQRVRALFRRIEMRQR